MVLAGLSHRLNWCFAKLPSVSDRTFLKCLLLNEPKSKWKKENRSIGSELMESGGSLFKYIQSIHSRASDVSKSTFLKNIPLT